MKYKKPEIATETDFTRFVGKVFVALYLFAVLGLVVTWWIEGGPLWPTVVTAIIAAPLMFAGFLVGRLPALRVFRERRKEAERKLKGLRIEQ